MLITDMVLMLYLFLIVTHVLGVVLEYSIILNIPIIKKRLTTTIFPLMLSNSSDCRELKATSSQLCLTLFLKACDFFNTRLLAYPVATSPPCKTIVCFHIVHGSCFLTPNLYLLNLSIDSPLQLFEMPSKIQPIYNVLNLLHYLK